jgi:hypothetical protein
MRRFLLASVGALIVCAQVPVGAWGFDVHRLIAERAIALLPTDIRPYYEKYRITFIEHAIDPDLWRSAGFEEEPPRHFVDLDAYGAPPFAALPHDYDEAVRKFGREFVNKNGTLPWRAAEISDRLVKAFADMNRPDPGYAYDNVKFFSSVLAHYVADAHVPLHATLNYDGQLTGQSGIHSRFEAELFERYRSRLTVAPRSIAPVGSVRDFVFDTLLASFPLAEKVLEADRTAAAGRDVYDDGYFAMFFGSVRPILERRLADSITASASVITAAWIEAGRPPLPVEPGRAPRPVRR